MRCKNLIYFIFCIESAAQTKATSKQHNISHTKCVKFLHFRARVFIICPTHKFE